MEGQEGRGVGEGESRRGEAKSKRQEKWVERARRDRSVQIIVCSLEWNQCMLNSVNKFQNAVLVTNWKIKLIFFGFPFQGAVFGQSEDLDDRRGGMIRDFIYWFIYFCK